MQLRVIDPEARNAPNGRDDRPMIEDEMAGAAADTTLEFGRFRVLPRRRQLLADGVPVELGTRAFDLLMVLIEANGRLITKDELLRRVWPTTLVDETNLKVQISKLRKALGPDGAFIRTDFGRGYRFTAVVRSTNAATLIALGAGPARERGLEVTELPDHLAYVLDPLHMERLAVLPDPRGEIVLRLLLVASRA